MSINFNHPAARGALRNLQAETYTVDEYEKSIKSLIPQILQFFFDDCTFAMRTTYGADAIFDVVVPKALSPKQTSNKPKQISIFEAPSPMGMMMMFGGGEAREKTQEEQTAWRFHAYLELYKTLKEMYPDGPTSVFGKANEIINKYKGSLDSTKEENEFNTSGNKKASDRDESEFRPIPLRSPWYYLMDREFHPNRFIGESEMRHGLNEMNVSYEPPEVSAAHTVDDDFEEAKRQAFESYGCMKSVIHVERKDGKLDTISDAITAHDGCATFQERREVLDLLDKFNGYLEERPVKLTVRGEQYVLEKFNLAFQNVNGVDYWWVGFESVAGVQAVMFIHDAETIHLLGQAENVTVS